MTPEANPVTPGRPCDVSVILVNYNGANLLPRCLHALGQATRSLQVETIVVDNGSQDGSLDLLRGAWQPTHLIAAGENLGFSRAMNRGAEVAHGRYYLLLNTDCFVRPGLVDALVQCLNAHPDAAMAGPRLCNADGTLQPSCHNFPAPPVLFLEQTSLWKVLRRVPRLREGLAVARDHRRPAAVDWLVGACLLIRAEAWEAAGGLDEGFFFYWEEADLCRRLQQQGWQVWFEPHAEAVHLGGGSSTHPALVAQFFTSLRRFYAKHYPGYAWTLARAIVRLMALYKALRAGLTLVRPGRADHRHDATGTVRQWLAVARR